MVFHFQMSFCGNHKLKKTLSEFSKYRITDVQYYRPPFGAITQNQIDFLSTKNIKTVLWSITTNDWDPKENKEGQLFEKFKNYIHNGAVVLMHDFDYSNLDAKLKDLEKMLQYGIKNGYKFVTVETIL